MNKTDFRIDVGRTYKVIVRKKNVQLSFFINDPDNHEFLTFIKYVNVNKFLILLILVMIL